MSAEMVWQIAAFLVAAGAVYGGIRNDLKVMHERQAAQDRAIERLHDRLDGCATCHGRRHGD